MLNYKGQNFLRQLYQQDKDGICYNLDYLQKILENIKVETSVIKNCKVLFAVKANYNKAILSIMSSKIDGFDCASIEEYRLIEKFGQSTISCTGLSFSNEDINFFIQKNIDFDFSSYSQFIKYKEQYMIENMGIRVRSTEEKTRFGFTNDELDLLLDHNVIVDRIHFHYGNRNLVSFVSELAKVKELFINRKILKSVKTINIGGSFEKIFANQEASCLMRSIEKFRCDISKLLENDIEIIIEPGDLLVRPIGFIKSTIIDQNGQYLTINTSNLNFSSWYLINKVFCKTKFFNALSNSKKSDNVYHIVGKSCNELDFFLDIENKFPMHVGTSVILFPAGSYTFFNPFGSIHGFKDKIYYYYNGDFYDEFGV